MMEQNWIAVDAVEDHPEMVDSSRYIRNFFENIWSEERFDYLRESWDKYLFDEDPHGRRYAKTALWALVRNRFPEIEQEFLRTMEE